MPKVAEIVNGKLVVHKPATETQKASFESMLESRRPPGLRTGNELFRGKANGRQFERDPDVGDMYAAEARRAGVSTAGKFYSHQLADYAGDPTAWVSDASDYADACRRKGITCEPLGVKGKSIEQAPPIALGEDIIGEEMLNRAIENPDLARSKESLAELREQVIEDHKPYWSE